MACLSGKGGNFSVSLVGWRFIIFSFIKSAGMIFLNGNSVTLPIRVLLRRLIRLFKLQALGLGLKKL